MTQGRQRRKRGVAAPGGGAIRRRIGPWAPLLLVAGGTVLVGLVLVFALGPSGGSGAGGNGQFPAYAYNSSMTLAGYKAAVKAPGALSVMPCYCGCGPAQGHLSLKECFFLPDGSFTDHASNCHLCVEEAMDVGKWYEDGLTLKVIRAAIEEKYSDHGPGTDTPPVS